MRVAEIEGILNLFRSKDPYLRLISRTSSYGRLILNTHFLIFTFNEFKYNLIYQDGRWWNLGQRDNINLCNETEISNISDTVCKNANFSFPHPIISTPFIYLAPSNTVKELSSLRSCSVIRHTLFFLPTLLGSTSHCFFNWLQNLSRIKNFGKNLKIIYLNKIIK